MCAEPRRTPAPRGRPASRRPTPAPHGHGRALAARPRSARPPARRRGRTSSATRPVIRGRAEVEVGVEHRPTAARRARPFARRRGAGRGAARPCGRASRPASPRKWVHSTTVRPRSVASDPIKSMTSRVAAGSRPDVGSSRNSTSGSWRSARASASRFRWPVEKPCTLSLARSIMPNSPRSSSTRSTPCAAAQPSDLGDEGEVLAGGQAVVEPGVLGQDAGAAAQLLAVGDGIEAEHAAPPRSGRSTPLSRRTVVVLPAPFGPSRASTSPASSSNVRPSSATFAAEAAGEVVRLDRRSHREQCDVSRRTGPTAPLILDPGLPVRRRRRKYRRPHHSEEGREPRHRARPTSRTTRGAGSAAAVRPRTRRCVSRSRASSGVRRPRPRARRSCRHPVRHQLVLRRRVFLRARRRPRRRSAQSQQPGPASSSSELGAVGARAIVVAPAGLSALSRLDRSRLPALEFCIVTDNVDIPERCAARRPPRHRAFGAGRRAGRRRSRRV